MRNRPVPCSLLSRNDVDQKQSAEFRGRWSTSYPELLDSSKNKGSPVFASTSSSTSSRRSLLTSFDKVSCMLSPNPSANRKDSLSASPSLRRSRRCSSSMYMLETGFLPQLPKEEYLFVSRHRRPEQRSPNHKIKMQSRSSSVPNLPGLRNVPPLPDPSLPDAGTLSLPKAPEVSKSALESRTKCTIDDGRKTHFSSEERSLGTSSDLQECDLQDSLPLAGVTVFEKLSNEGMLLCTSIHSALQLMGYGSMDVSHVEAALKKARKGSTKDSITLKEFSAFVSGYNSLHEKNLRYLFKKADTDGSGQISRQELGAMISNSDIKMFPPVIDEVFKEVDLDHTGTIDMLEFREVMRILRERQGFSREEANNVLQVFKRFDREHTGEVQVSVLGQLLEWLGYHPKEHELSDLIIEIDIDKSGTISPIELPLFVRKFRELELNKVGHFFGTHDKDYSGKIELTEMEELLRELGYPMALSAMSSFLDETNLSRVAQEGLVFEDFWRLLAYIRKNEGFTAAEQKEQYSAFEQYADAPEEVEEKHLVAMEDRRARQLPKSKVRQALQWLGLKSISSIEDIVAEVDFDHSQTLDFEEFLKLMRNIHKSFADTVLQAFSMPDGHQRVASKITLDSPDMDAIVRKLGIKLSTQQKESVFEEMNISATGEASFYECLGIVQQMRDTMVKFMREMSGFTANEVTEWRAVFDNLDRDRSGTITENEMERMMQSRLTLLASISTEDDLKLIIEDARKAEMGTGGVDFPAFLKVMRAHADRSEMVRMKDKWRLSQAKQLFEAADVNGDHELSQEEVCSMIGLSLSSVDMQAKLERLTRELDEDNSGTLDSNEFKKLVTVLQTEKDEDEDRSTMNEQGLAGA